jgi:hypothetical protein
MFDGARRTSQFGFFNTTTHFESFHNGVAHERASP